MVGLLFLLGLLATLFLLYRASRRDKKLREAIEANRDIKNEMSIEKIREENEMLLKQMLTKGENNADK